MTEHAPRCPELCSASPEVTCLGAGLEVLQRWSSSESPSCSGLQLGREQARKPPSRRTVCADTAPGCQAQAGSFLPSWLGRSDKPRAPVIPLLSLFVLNPLSHRSILWAHHSESRGGPHGCNTALHIGWLLPGLARKRIFVPLTILTMQRCCESLMRSTAGAAQG